MKHLNELRKEAFELAGAIGLYKANLESDMYTIKDKLWIRGRLLTCYELMDNLHEAINLAQKEI